MEDKEKQLIEYIPGGKSEGLTPDDVAKKHGVEVSVINKQIKMGIEIEHEHSPDDKVAAEIAKDHLVETPYYYDYLEAMEKEFKENYKEDLERGGMEEEDKGKSASEDQVIEFLKENPNPEDEDVHEWCGKEGFNKHTTEAVFYKFATKYVQSLDEDEEEGEDSMIEDKKKDPEEEAKKKKEEEEEDKKKKKEAEEKEEEDAKKKKKEEEEKEKEEEDKKKKKGGNEEGENAKKEKEEPEEEEEEPKKKEKKEEKKKGMIFKKKDSSESKREVLKRLFGV